MKLKTMQADNITFAFDGGLADVTVNPSAMHDAIRNHAMLMGIQARIRDNAALARKQPDGSIITITEAMRHAAATEMAAHLATATEWSSRAAAVPKQNAAILAISVKRGCTYAEAEAWVVQRAQEEMDTAA